MKPDHPRLAEANLRKQVWSCGGGTQSCAIAALIIQGRLPKPDMILMADTGRETQTTWDYLRDVVQPGLATVGLSVRVLSSEEYGYNGISLFTHNGGELLLPAFTTQNGNAKLPAFCSKWWKTDVATRWLSMQGLPPRTVRTWIGYGREEQLRWAKCMDGEDYKKGAIWLPLVTVIPLRRHDCQRLIQSMGWPTPAPRSRCWMCPNQSDSEWGDLPPEEFQKAVELEREMQKRDPDAWLHKSCRPLDQVDFSQPDDLFNRPCDSGQCFV